MVAVLTNFCNRGWKTMDLDIMTIVGSHDFNKWSCLTILNPIIIQQWIHHCDIGLGLTKIKGSWWIKIKGWFDHKVYWYWVIKWVFLKRGIPPKSLSLLTIFSNKPCILGVPNFKKLSNGYLWRLHFQAIANWDTRRDVIELTIVEKLSNARMLIRTEKIRSWRFTASISAWPTPSWA